MPMKSRFANSADLADVRSTSWLWEAGKDFERGHNLAAAPIPDRGGWAAEPLEGS